VKIVLITSFVFLISACASSPSNESIQTAIAETQNSVTEHQSIASITPSPLPTFTPESTITPTTEPTFTYTPEPSPTPTSTPDIRIISGDPEDYILVPEDLPDKYILRRGNSTPHLNSEILSARGTEDGKSYLDATGRIGGWIIWYRRVSDIPIAPDWIRSYIVIYDNIDGPLTAISPEFDWITDIDDAEVLDIDLDLGDWNRTFMIRERQSNGEYRVFYHLEFIYKNVWAEIYGKGWESDVTHEYIEHAARKVLTKLQEAPLVEPKDQ